MVSLGTRIFPERRVCFSKSSKCGQGASGLTKSGVIGDTPPQSLIPASISKFNLFGLRFGGA